MMSPQPDALSATTSSIATSRTTAPTRAHARAMDNIYRHQRYIYDVTRRYYLFGRNEMIAQLNPRPADRILEVGCGTARNLIQAGERHLDTQLYGFDISNEMLTTAGAAVERAGLRDRISLAQGDATAFDGEAMFGVRRFERIFISYSLSMIPNWHDVVRSAARQLAPGGSLHIVDFGNMQGLPSPARSVLHRWLTLFHVTPRPDLVPVARAIAEQHRLTTHVAHGRFRYATHVTLRRR